MKERYVFHPPRRAGLLLDTAIIIGLVFAAIFGLRGVANAEIGLTFLLYLLPVLVAAVLTPIFFYYVFALQRSYYTLRRDGISLHWGLRLEDIPIDRVEWVRLASDLSRPLPAPPLRLPGAMLGVRHDPSLGEVEFIASRASGMVLVHTPARTFAISPEDPKAFLQAYRQLSEYGSLTPMPARSQFPGFLLARLWSDRPARGLDPRQPAAQPGAAGLGQPGHPGPRLGRPGSPGERRAARPGARGAPAAPAGAERAAGAG